MTYKESFIRFMVDCGVLTFGEFTLKAVEKHHISSTAETTKQVHSLLNSVNITQSAFMRTTFLLTLFSDLHIKEFRLQFQQ